LHLVGRFVQPMTTTAKRLSFIKRPTQTKSSGEHSTSKTLRQTAGLVFGTKCLLPLTRAVSVTECDAPCRGVDLEAIPDLSLGSTGLHRNHGRYERLPWSRFARTVLSSPKFRRYDCRSVLVVVKVSATGARCSRLLPEHID
jgi:hypothetical protein